MGIISTQAFTFRLIANGQQLDLFQDEDILLSNNVTGLFDIGVLPSDFTRQITIPGTKVNNAFFEHVYDISIDNPFLFATNIKVPAYFEFDSVYLSNGYIQLNQVNVVANKFIESYEITIYGTLSSFGRDINRNYLTDLSSLSSYNHTSSYDNISSSWGGHLFNGDIVYPFADYGKGWSMTAGDDFFGLDDANGAITTQDYKPAIRIKPVLDAIFSEAGYTYSSSFFAQDWINDVYLLCNNSLRYPEYPDVDLENYGVIKIAAISGSGMTDLNLPDNTWTTLPWYNVLSDRQNFVGQNGSYKVDISSSFDGVINLNFNVSSSIGNIPAQWNLRMIETGSSADTSTTTLINFNNYFTQIAQSRSGSINQTYEVSTAFYFGMVDPGYYYFQIQPIEYYAAASPLVTLDPGGTNKSFLEIRKVRQAADGRVLDIPSNMPYGTTGIKQIDFITGLQKKFNLVIYPDKTKLNHFIIETFNNWYKRGQVRDFNRYINLDERIEVIPANNLAVNKLTLGDTLDQDYISQQFSKAANREYGKTYYIDTTNFYSQGEFNVKTTFASDPLVRVAGTGLSGSVSGITPSITVYNAGSYKFGYTYDPTYTCSSPITYANVYTTTGFVEYGVIVYADQYGQNPIQGLKFIVPSSGGQILNLASNGLVGSYTGYNC